MILTKKTYLIPLQCLLWITFLLTPLNARIDIRASQKLYGNVNKGANILTIDNKLDRSLIFKTDFEKRTGAKSRQKRELIKDGISLIVKKGGSKTKFFKAKDDIEYYIGKPKRDLTIIYKDKKYDVKFPRKDTVEEVQFKDGLEITVSFEWDDPGWRVQIEEVPANRALQIAESIVGVKLFL